MQERERLRGGVVGMAEPGVFGRRTLKVLMDTLPAAVFISDEKGGLIYTNAKAEEIWHGVPGVATAEDYGMFRGWWTDTGEQLRPEDWSGSKALHGEIVTGQVVDIERFDGTRGTILNSSTPIRDDDGTIIGQVTIQEDVTERAQMMEELRRTVAELGRTRQRLEQELEATAALLEAVRSVAERDEPSAVMEQFARSMRAAIGRKRVWVLTWDDQSQVATLVAMADDTEGRPWIGTRFSVEELPPALVTSLRERRTVVINRSDSSGQPMRGFAEHYGFCSTALTPIAHEERLVGVVVVDDPSAYRPFDEGDLRVLEGVATQAAVSFEYARLHVIERDRARFGETLAMIDRNVHSSLQVEDIVLSALSDGAKAIGAETAAIDGVVGDDEWVVWYDWGFEPSIVGDHYNNRENPHGKAAIDSGATIAIDDAYHDPRVDHDTMKSYSLRSAIVAPLVVGGRPFGALYYNYHSGIHHFTEAEVEFVRGVASSLSLAIENSRLYDAMRRELLRTKILREVAAAASALDLNAVADTVLEVGERLLGARAGAVYRMKMSRKGLRCIALRGYDPSTLPIFDDVPIDESSISGLSILRDQPVFLGHEELPQTTRQRADATNETGTGWVAIPAHAHGRIVGNVTLVFEERRVLDEEDVELFRSIGDQLGAAMETARLFEGERDSARYNAALNAIHSRLTSTLEIDRVLQEVLEGTMSAVGADVGMVFTPIDGHWLVAAISGTDAVALGQVLRNVEIPFSRAVSERGQSNLFSEPRKEPGWEDSVANIVGARQVLDGPLFLGRKESGNIALYRTTPGRDWREADRDFLQKVAVSVSLALQNAQRFESEHHVAETLQTALLALPDSVPGLDFAHAYHSATEEARVGGDFYDLFELRDGRVGITVGDISGHGVESAVLTSLVKDAIRVQATEEDKPPNEVMASANRVLYENSTSELFATVFFGVLDLQTGWFEYCNAGHTTGACLYTRQSSLTQLPPNSPLIGAFPDITFEKSFHQVLPDDVVFLYTDGLTEARRGRELFGEERLFGLLGDLRSRRPADLVREVVDEVNRFTGGELSDDMAILAFQRSEQLPLRRSGE